MNSTNKNFYGATTMDYTLREYIKGAISGKGISLYSKQNYNLALEQFNSIILNYKPQDGPTYYWRGQTYIKLGRFEDACKDFSKAGELGYSNAYELIKLYCN